MVKEGEGRVKEVEAENVVIREKNNSLSLPSLLLLFSLSILFFPSFLCLSEGGGEGREVCWHGSFQQILCHEGRGNSRQCRETSNDAALSGFCNGFVSVTNETALLSQEPHFASRRISHG